jgi:hypothetical protein
MGGGHPEWSVARRNGAAVYDVMGRSHTEWSVAKRDGAAGSCFLSSLVIYISVITEFFQDERRLEYQIIPATSG